MMHCNVLGLRRNPDILCCRNKLFTQFQPQFSEENYHLKFIAPNAINTLQDAKQIDFPLGPYKYATFLTMVLTKYFHLRNYADEITKLQLKLNFRRTTKSIMPFASKGWFPSREMRIAPTSVRQLCIFLPNHKRRN